MLRSRAPDVALKPLARGLSQLRTSSDSDPLQRHVKDRSPRLVDRRSPKGPQLDPMNQKKLGTRIEDLEFQLGEAQAELKNLKGQLASAEVAKKEAQEKLERKVKKHEVVGNVETDAKQHNKEIQELDGKDNNPNEDIINQQWETDVFEVQKRKLSAEPQKELVPPNDQSQKDAKPADESTKSPEISELIQISSHDLVLKDEEISSLKATLKRKDDDIKVLAEENELIKKQLAEAKADISSAEAKGNEMASKLTLLVEELQASKTQATVLNEKLQSVEQAKAGLESEMKQLRVQTEQWRKAADAAAAVLAGDADMNGGRNPERCGSMDKHFPGFVGSPGYMGIGKRKGTGIRMFGDLWKKKDHK
ncbi:unnamed protein product [Rhodiola kirilowii]